MRALVEPNAKERLRRLAMGNEARTLEAAFTPMFAESLAVQA